MAYRNSWRGKVHFTGFLPADQVASLLAVSDAVVLPFPNGGGEWNSSIHAATVNGAFVLTTSLSMQGYQSQSNIYYANPNNLNEMKVALNKYAGRKRNCANEYHNEWLRVAAEHNNFYEEITVQ